MTLFTPSYKRHRFPSEIIAHAVWLYHRFNLSFREVEEMLLERGIDVSYETVRRWVAKFGPAIARGLRRRQPSPGDAWHLDEVRVKIGRDRFWLWRAVDQDGIVLDEVLQRRRDKRAARRLLGIAKLLGSDCEGLAKAVSCRHFGGVICPEAEGIVAGVAV